MKFRVAAGWMMALAVSTEACAVEDVVATRMDGVCVDGNCDAAPHCSTPSPRLLVGDATCDGPLVARFERGLCLCEDLVTSHPVVARGGDPTSVGVNGTLNATGGVLVDGSLTVAGGGGIAAGQSADVDVDRDLESQGDVSGGGAVRVGGNARFGGNVGVGELSVAGTLTQPAGSTLSVTGTQSVGARETADVVVEPSCVCDASMRPDVALRVAEARDDNDNVRAQLGTFDLEGLADRTIVEVPCGRYHVSEISGSGSLALVGTGGVTLYVDGSIRLDGDLEIYGSDGAPFELLVAESVRVGGTLVVGEPGRSARIVLGGSGVSQTSGPVRVFGVLYAPDAEWVTEGDLAVAGAALFRRLVAGGRVDVSYDPRHGVCEGP